MHPFRNLWPRGAVVLGAALLPRLAAAQMPSGSAAPMPSASPASPYPPPPSSPPPSAAPAWPGPPPAQPPSTYPPAPTYPSAPGSSPSPSTYPPTSAPAYPPSPAAPTPAYPPYGAAPVSPAPPAANASSGWYMAGAAPPAAAPAPTPAPATVEPAADFRWSLGAGVGFAGVGNTFSTGMLTALSTSGTRSPPLLSPRVAIEARVGANSWLVLTATASYASFEETVANQAPSTPSMTDERKTLAVSTTRLAALVGLRQVVVRGIVEVSLSFAAGVSRERAGGDAPQGTEVVYEVTPGSSATTFGGVAGLVVEKELLRGLALRLSTDVVGAGIGNVDHVDWADGVATHTPYTSGYIGMTLSPAILLQFYF